jgi:hypothetical protein
MTTTIEPGERRALVVVLAMTLLSLGMLGVIIPAPAPERMAAVGTVYSADHAAIRDDGSELPAQF